MKKECMQTWEKDCLPKGIDYFGYCVFNHATERLKPHFHNGIEFIVLLKGTDHYIVDGRMYEIHGGEAFIAYPRQIHASGREHHGMGEYLWFQLDLNCKKDFLGLSPKNSRYLLKALSEINSHVIKVDYANIQILKKCYKNLKNKSNDFIIENLLANFVYNVLFDNQKKPAEASTIERIKAYIDDSLAEDLSAEKIARHFYISVSTLQHSFCRETGQTLLDYINSKRIEKARELLSAGKTVTETAMETGFSTSNYFATVFKRYTFMTPSQFLKRMHSMLL